MIEISKTNEDKFVQTIRILQGMLDEADLPEYEALKTAIKSLEAWELVKQEIERFKTDCNDSQNTTIKMVLEIIDKYLEEVEDDKA